MTSYVPELSLWGSNTNLSSASSNALDWESSLGGLGRAFMATTCANSSHQFNLSGSGTKYPSFCFCRAMERLLFASQTINKQNLLAQNVPFWISISHAIITGQTHIYSRPPAHRMRSLFIFFYIYPFIQFSVFIHYSFSLQLIQTIVLSVIKCDREYGREEGTH